MGRYAEAEVHFDRALQDNTRFDAQPWVVRTQLELATMLLARDGPGDRTAADDLLADALATARSLKLAPIIDRIVAARNGPRDRRRHPTA